MPFRIIITEHAERDMGLAHDWWASNRSRKQADEWYKQFKAAILGLAESPRRCGTSRESPLFPFEIRDLLFGLGSRPTHRAVFTIRGDDVVILAIRHVAQADLRRRDLSISVD